MAQEEGQSWRSAECQAAIHKIQQKPETQYVHTVSPPEAWPRTTYENTCLCLRRDKQQWRQQANITGITNIEQTSLNWYYIAARQQQMNTTCIDRKVLWAAAATLAQERSDILSWLMEG